MTPKFSSFARFEHICIFRRNTRSSILARLCKPIFKKMHHLSANNSATKLSHESNHTSVPIVTKITA